MGKVLVIAEKPDAGRNMAKVLKCDNCKDGYIENEKYIVDGDDGRHRRIAVFLLSGRRTCS